MHQGDKLFNTFDILSLNSDNIEDKPHNMS